jgi:hypothetical protein
MPYIKHADRERFNKVLWAAEPPFHAGELNYLLTRILHAYIFERGESYATYNEVIGALECAKLELYRRKVAKYEDAKITENGDLP